MSATAAIATPHDNFIDLKITQSEFTRCKALGFAFWELVSQSAIGHSESEVSCGTACLPTRSSKRRTKSDKISTHAISGASMNGDEFPLSLPTSLSLSLSLVPIAVNAKLSAKLGATVRKCDPSLLLLLLVVVSL